MKLSMIIDLAVILIFAACVIGGLVSGLLKMLLRLAAAVGAVIAGIFLSGPVAGWIFKALVAPSLIKSLTGKIAAYNSTGAAIELPFGLQNLITGQLLSSGEPAAVAENLVNNVFASTVQGTIRIIVFVAIFLIVLLILLWVAKSAKKLNSVPIVGPVNRVFGGLFGALTGFLVCYAAALLCSFVVSAMYNVISAAAQNEINSAVIYNFLLNTNLISLIN